ncbi:hypothetical protein Ais01nite_24400 [Asanoa ishikariensis]|uniref:Uncharacterized protein n=1 Tax=Asanoa ishikariensis TaxID=137265 RepID=A0A1H3R5C0_9ACTN|nr:hypothetical protein [Asanoa ishikariensis]GIF64405.1 hypothetical protein Ais01nite_24400 [Asanoa ishikariensis]SDZ20796.1 hypothetical protein SAMN05421684_3479 [Asanoa ishikariensis]
MTIVEVVLLSAADGALRFRTVSDRLPAGVHPDDLALHLSGLTLCTPGATLHSTSWRFASESVVLTYAALPDPTPTTTAPLSPDRMVTGRAALAPSPPDVDTDAVAAHAARHLALLTVTDPVVAAAASAQPDLWDLLTKLPTGLAGALR